MAIKLKPIHPGEHLREDFMKPLGLSSNALARVGRLERWERWLKVIDYLHANPVRRGLMARAEDWEWSSARWYAGLRPVTLAMDRGVLAELAHG